jgi:hypothetical protein
VPIRAGAPLRRGAPLRPGVAAVAAAACLIAGSAAHTPAQPADLVVHEWGTFTSVAGEDGRAVEWLALDGPTDLPCFVDRALTTWLKSRPATVRMETPVLYFYTPRETTVDVRVEFPQGAITEFFPRGTVDVPRLTPTGLGKGSGSGSITWRNVRIVPGAAPAFRTESAPSHYYAARATDAAPLEVGADRERFLFYRGVGRTPLPIAASVDAHDTVTVTGLDGHDVPAAMLFENRGGRVGHRVQGRVIRDARLSLPELTGTLDSTRAALQRMLVGQGLYPKEAAAMLETWRDTWFDEGARLFFIVPPAVVDTMLPLTIDPAPARVTRVFVGRLELATRATLSAIRQAAATRDEARLQAQGRFLRPFLERLLAERLSSGDRARFESLMTRTSAVSGGAPSACR